MKGSWDSDRDPLLALQRGDASLFEEFVRLEAGTLIAFFGRLGADRWEARDLSQKVFMKLFRGAERYTPQSAFSSYALRVAKNAWIDARRRSGVRPHLLESDAEDDDGESLFASRESREPAPWAALATADERARLERALARLPRAQAVVFDLAVVQRKPYPDIAEVLEIPVGTVKSRVFNAVRALRELLRSFDETEDDGGGR